MFSGLGFLYPLDLGIWSTLLFALHINGVVHLMY